MLKLDLAKRHMDPISWGFAFERLLELRCVRTGRAARKDTTSATVAEVAAEAGVSERTARHRLAQARAFDELTDDAQKRIRAGDASIQQVRREQKEQIREKRRERNREPVEATPTLTTSMGDATFATIVIDPPWSPADKGEHGEGVYGRGNPPYETMDIEDIKRLPVGTFADDDCHIFLWITNRSLFKGRELLEEWSFRYVTTFTWCKPHFGLGKYFRGSTEHVLFGVKGSQPLKRRDVGTWFEAPRGPNGHSSKPVAYYDLVESCSPGPYLEIFARGGRDGWISWGAEADR